MRTNYKVYVDKVLIYNFHVPEPTALNDRKILGKAVEAMEDKVVDGKYETAEIIKEELVYKITL